MAVIHDLLAALDPGEIARRVSLPHDEARMLYPLRTTTVGTFDEFTGVLAEYVSYHFTRCVSHGGSLSRAEAAGRAKDILNQQYRRRGGDVTTAFTDARDGTNGGLRSVLDQLCEVMKAEAVERYITDVFDRYVAPSDWDGKVELIRQFIRCCGPYLSSSIRADQPERYAANYRELIRAYCDGLRDASSVFRRL